MDAGPYRVDARMIPPVIMALAAGLLLLILEGPTRRGFLTGFILSPFFYLAGEILARSITLDDTGITISKLFRKVRLEWSEIESLDAVRSGSKVFLILQPEDRRPTLITNTLARFGDLARAIMERIPKGKTTEAARELAASPPAKHWPMIQAWVVCVVVSAVAGAKLMGY